jgi:hypothetical protein
MSVEIECLSESFADPDSSKGLQFVKYDIGIEEVNSTSIELVYIWIYASARAVTR